LSTSVKFVGLTISKVTVGIC